MNRQLLFSIALAAVFILLIIFGSKTGAMLQRFLGVGVLSSEEVPEKALFEGNVKDLAVYVYSRYPFNFKNEIVVAAGLDKGVRNGAPVVFGDTLLGTVIEVFPESARVRTIFDSEYKIAVRIATSGIDALLVGGNQPRLTLISEDAQVNPGDPAYSAGTAAPYGLVLGKIENLYSSKDNLFREANLRVPYNLPDVHIVKILPHPDGQ